MKKNNPTSVAQSSTRTEKQLSTITDVSTEKRVVSWLTYEPEAGEVNTLPSETQPNDTLSVQQILHRFANGLPLGTGDIGFYDDPEDMDFSDFDRMDKFEKADYIRDQRDYIQELEQRVKDEQVSEEKEGDPKDPLNSSAPQEQE